MPETKTKKSNVFAVSFSGHNYDKLNNFGEVTFMTNGLQDLRQHPKYEAIIDNFIKVSNEADFLMFSGSCLICAIALKVWLKYHEKCHVLIWDGVRRDYHQYTITR